MKKKRLLDSFALLAYLKKEKGHERIKSLLSHDEVILMNEINLGEVFYILARERGMSQAEYFINVILPSLPIIRMGNVFEDVLAAAKIKGGHALSFADCFAAATAIRENAAIITGDPEFKQLEKEVEIEWI